ncbi:MAG: flagellar assembly protein FliW [Ignavibacteriales bacterium]|nr:flagellar assembly protein FliW [Ignavibacteriales bacterium]
MKINTHQFGEVEYSEDLVINFAEGLFGFENLHKYLFIKTEDELFYWLNSVEQPDIAFALIGLRIIDEKFPTIEENEAFGIVTFSKNPADVKVNLKAPVYVNQDSKSGFQKIIDSDKYPIAYNLFVEEKQS